MENAQDCMSQEWTRHTQNTQVFYKEFLPAGRQCYNTRCTVDQQVELLLMARNGKDIEWMMLCMMAVLYERAWIGPSQVVAVHNSFSPSVVSLPYSDF